MSCVKPDNNSGGDVVCDVGNPLPANRRVCTNQIKSIYLLTAAKKKERKRNITAKGQEGQK